MTDIPKLRGGHGGGHHHYSSTFGTIRPEKPLEPHWAQKTEPFDVKVQRRILEDSLNERNFKSGILDTSKLGDSFVTTRPKHHHRYPTDKYGYKRFGGSSSSRWSSDPYGSPSRRRNSSAKDRYNHRRRKDRYRGGASSRDPYGDPYRFKIATNATYSPKKDPYDDASDIERGTTFTHVGDPYNFGRPDLRDEQSKLGILFGDDPEAYSNTDDNERESTTTRKGINGRKNERGARKTTGRGINGNDKEEEDRDLIKQHKQQQKKKKKELRSNISKKKKKNRNKQHRRNKGGGGATERRCANQRRCARKTRRRTRRAATARKVGWGG